MAELRLLVMRHGQTDYNHSGRFQGSIDIPLNEAGRSQAKFAIDYLKLQGIDHLLSSPQRRAFETAAIVGEGLGLEVETRADFVERNYGVFEGKTRQEIQLEYPDLWQKEVSRQMHASPPQAESLFELGMRAHRGITQLQQQYRDKTILLVCHGGILRAIHGLLRRVSDERYFSYQLDNGEMDDYMVPSL